MPNNRILYEVKVPNYDSIFTYSKKKAIQYYKSAIQQYSGVKFYEWDTNKRRHEMKIEGKIPMATEVKAMTIEDLIAIAAKYDMYFSLSLTPLKKEEDDYESVNEGKSEVE